MLISMLMINCNGNELHIGYLKLEQNKLQDKQRYVFSDFQSDPEVDLLKNASISINLGFYPLLYETWPKSYFIRVFMIVANKNHSEYIKKALDPYNLKKE